MKIKPVFFSLIFLFSFQTGVSQMTNTVSSYETISEGIKDKPDKFNLKVGINAFSFSDPMLSGLNTTFTVVDITTGSLSGYRYLGGPYFKASYYINSNLGFFTDMSFLYVENGTYTESTTYSSTAEVNLFKVGVTGQVTGDEFPIKINLGFGAGLCNSELYTSASSNVGSGGTYLLGDSNNPVLFINSEISIPIYKFIELFAQYEFSFVPTDSYRLYHDGGTEYYEMAYRTADLGGSHFKFGIGFTF